MRRLNSYVPSVLCVALIASATACNTVGADASSDPQLLGTAAQALLGSDIFGSDTLFDAMTAAFAAAPLSSPLVYRGTGSGNGERCIRGQAPPDVCAANPPVQAIAPMSRALNAPRAGEVNVRIAVDGIAIVANAAAEDPGLALADVLTAFCGADGQGADSEASCAAPGRLAGAKFRRDDTSGTTEVFEQLSGCSAFCADVAIVEESVDGPSIGGALPAGCEATDTATSCIGKLVAADASAIGYAGRSVLNVAGTQAFSVNGIAFADATLQALVSDPASAYPFARFVFLNANLDNLIGSGSVQEEFFQWSTSVDPQSFEDILVANDFIACSPDAPLACEPPPAPAPDAGAADAGE